jgi:uncharacterized protein
MQPIILGRLKPDQEKYGTRGTILLGKQYVQMGQITSLSNLIYMDISGAHVIFICGKRGGGKSYTMGVIAEGMADLDPEIKERLSIILVDTMGIYWTMKYANARDDQILREWGYKPHPLDITIYTPKGFFNKYKEEGIPTDKPFALRPADLDPDDWFLTFEIDKNSDMGILLERTIMRVKKTFADFDIDDIILAIEEDPKSERKVKDALQNRFSSTKDWGVFDKEGTSLADLAGAGKVTVLDVSCYATMPGGWKIKALVLGIVSQRLFIQRMLARKYEEFQEINKAVSYFEENEGTDDDMPLVWLVVDEAHEFLPREGKTASSDALITIMREGRQPGISLILATQQPGKIHTDVMTQSDILISHRITAKLDTDALGMLMQSYMRDGLDIQLNTLPRSKGSALIVDDANERIYPMRVRPRFTWHGGASPTALNATKKNVDIKDLKFK